MTTLITGVTGAVGSRYARRSGGRIRVLVRDEERAAPWWNRGAEVVVGDLRDPDTVKRAVAGVAAVVHLAVVVALLWRTTNRARTRATRTRSARRRRSASCCACTRRAYPYA